MDLLLLSSMVGSLPLVVSIANAAGRTEFPMCWHQYKQGGIGNWIIIFNRLSPMPKTSKNKDILKDAKHILKDVFFFS